MAIFAEFAKWFVRFIAIYPGWPVLIVSLGLLVCWRRLSLPKTFAVLMLKACAVALVVYAGTTAFTMACY
jgi:hypothetical protein